MSLIYTYKNITRNSAPTINNTNLPDYTYVYGKPQPIKHWRKQLKPVNKDTCNQKIEVFKANDCFGIQNGSDCIQTQKVGILFYQKNIIVPQNNIYNLNIKHMNKIKHWELH
jgi:hypothetical protein